MSDSDGRTDRAVHVSIVLCTRERGRRLSRTLEAYEQIRSTRTWELAVVINASVDSTRAVVEQFRARTRVPLLVLEEPVPGICAALNAGWRNARGEIVTFVDDDCYPAADYVDQLVACFAEPHIGYLGGRMAPFDERDRPVSVHLNAQRVDLPPRSAVQAGVVHGGNMAFRRATLEAIGGFDTWLGAGTPVRAGGDADAVSRASAAGYAGCFDPRPLVHHDHRRKTAEDENRARAGYDIGRGAFLLKCVLDRRRRSIYAPALGMRLREHFRRRRFGMLAREVQGALTYLVTRGLRL
jgi:glycosyltransferase involved in cell wall biosynthesis